MLRRLKIMLMVVVTASLPWIACSDGSTTEGAATSNYRAKPRAIGDVNKVNIVADPQLLETSVGDSIIYHYEQPYPLMPQPEPVYDLRYMTAEDLIANEARRELRNYVILADLTNTTSPTTQFVQRMLGEERMLAAREDYRKGSTVVTDQWANGQILVYLYAEGPDKLAELVAKSFKSAQERITNSDREVLVANIYQSGRAERLQDSIQRLLGIGIDVPQDYLVAKAANDFIWLRRDIKDVVQNLLIGVVPYVGPQQLTADSAVVYRNALSRDAVRTNTQGSVMATNGRDLPILAETIEIDGVQVFEARGVWEMSDDYMGGPFFTYLIPDEASNKLYVVDAFVYAPGSKKGKRNYMQQLETIVRSIKI